jgi:hypothetical protein
LSTRPATAPGFLLENIMTTRTPKPATPAQKKRFALQQQMIIALRDAALRIDTPRLSRYDKEELTEVLLGIAATLEDIAYEA